VVTAAHCLPDIKSDTVHVLPAYNKGAFREHLQAPGQSFRRLEDNDIAVLCDSSSTSPGLPFSGSGSKQGQSIVVTGYSVPKIHVQQSHTCTVSAVSGNGIGTLDCPLPPGTSGAPVLTAERGEVIGVVSASRQGMSVFTSIDAAIFNDLCN